MVEFDWLVQRTWNKPNEVTEVCLLTTRGYILARHVRDHIRCNLKAKDQTVGGKPLHYKPTAGLRRYRTESGADKKVVQLNEKFSTSGYNSIREDQI